MDVKDQLTDGDKNRFKNLNVEIQVLTNLLAEKQQHRDEHLRSVLARLGYPPDKYGLEFNAGQDKWEVRLRKDALVVPGFGRDPFLAPKPFKLN